MIISPALLERSRTIWDNLVAEHVHGPLPFVRIDHNGEIASFWDVADSGDQFDDLATGIFYAELLVHRAKTVRGNFDPFQMIAEVLMAIAQKGKPGVIERGFIDRIAMLAVAAALN
jgi:hypothetical protein